MTAATIACRPEPASVEELCTTRMMKDRHVRIRTSMQMNWERAFVARDLANGAAKTTTLTPVSVNLHSRGFSRMYRKGGRYEPYRFDYDDVRSEPRFPRPAVTEYRTTDQQTTHTVRIS